MVAHFSKWTRIFKILWPIVIFLFSVVRRHRYACWLLTFTITPMKHKNSPVLQRSWWRHEMETFSAFLALCEGNPPVIGGFPTNSSDAELWCFLWSAFEQTLCKQSRRRWFETPSRYLWRHCNAMQYQGWWMLGDAGGAWHQGSRYWPIFP